MTPEERAFKLVEHDIVISCNQCGDEWGGVVSIKDEQSALELIAAAITAAVEEPALLSVMSL